MLCVRAPVRQDGRATVYGLGRGLAMESIPKLVETAVTSSSSGSGGGDAIGTTDPEFSLNRGTEQREVAVGE